MRRHARLLIALIVASTLPGSALVMAQIKVEVKAAAPAKADVKTEEAKPVQANVAVKAEPTNLEAALEPLIQQYLPRIRPLVRAEVHFIISACKPTKDQRAVLAREGERVLKEVTKKYAQAYQKLRTRGWNANDTQPDVQKLIADGMADVVKAHLSAEQAARYKVEAQARAADLKRVAIHNLVASLDEELTLSPDQRTKLVDSLAANWDDSWCRSLNMLMYYTAYFPNVPDKVVVPFLNPTQKTIWERKPKQQGMSWWSFGFLGNEVAIEEDPAEGDDSGELKKDDEKSAEKTP